MFRLRRVTSFLWRRFHAGTVNRDQVMEQLQICSAEHQVLDVVGENKAKLTSNHVSCALEMLWQFQKEKPDILRTAELIKRHPQFLTLQVLAENNISFMNDIMLVDMLYNLLRLEVEPHHPLVQQLVSNVWLRIDGLTVTSISKFAVCLVNQDLQHSPLMGHITSLVDQHLPSIDDARVLTTLMINISFLVSPRLRDALVNKIDHVMDTMDPSNVNNVRRVVQFLRNIKYKHQPLLEKCNKILLCHIPELDIDYISMIMGQYQSLQFRNCDFRLAVKQRLLELLDSNMDNITFTKLFVALAPMANPEISERLENTTLLLADELNSYQVVAVSEALAEIKSRNLSLLNKIASAIERYLHVYRPVEVVRVTQALLLLNYQKPELFIKLRNSLVNFLQRSFITKEVDMLIRVLSMIPCTRLEDSFISRIDAMAAQYKLSELVQMSSTVGKWVRNDPAYQHHRHHNSPDKCASLLQNLNQYAHERLQKARRLDSILEELKYISSEFFEETLAEESMVTLQRMMDQINWTNVPMLAIFLTKIQYLCPALLERIASVIIKDIDKIHYSAINTMLLPFCVLNYDPVQADELYEACIQVVTPHISSFDPHELVLLAYTLSLADRFPEEIVREIFSIDFLGKLDTELETLSDVHNKRVRNCLMKVNRAVCLECPEFQVPWFHDHFCQKQHRKGSSLASAAKQHIHKMLGEVLNGFDYVQVDVVAPYFYIIDFECILDKQLQPLPYSAQLSLPLISDRANVHWWSSWLEEIMDKLPPGAQRVAVVFLNSKSFCKNCHRMKGGPLKRKKHLEILGYHVVHIPHFEWNSMELSTQDAWKEHLRKKIFTELSC